MIQALTRGAGFGALVATAMFAAAAPALAQAPTEAQREAIKSECRNDYIAHCSSIPPGGEASLQCLQKNMSSLSSACASAVRAVEAPAAAAPKTESAPAAAKTEPRPRQRQPSLLPRPQRPRPRQAQWPRSQAAPRSRPSAAPAAPIIRRSAPACRPAAPPRCNAWRRTNRRFRRLARTPSALPAAALQHLRQAAHRRQLRRTRPRLPLRHRP